MEGSFRAASRSRLFQASCRRPGSGHDRLARRRGHCARNPVRACGRSTPQRLSQRGGRNSAGRGPQTDAGWALVLAPATARTRIRRARSCSRVCSREGHNQADGTGQNSTGSTVPETAMSRPRHVLPGQSPHFAKEDPPTFKPRSGIRVPGGPQRRGAQRASLLTNVPTRRRVPRPLPTRLLRLAPPNIARV